MKDIFLKASAIAFAMFISNFLWQGLHEFFHHDGNLMTAFERTWFQVVAVFIFALTEWLFERSNNAAKQSGNRSE